MPFCTPDRLCNSTRTAADHQRLFNASGPKRKQWIQVAKAPNLASTNMLSAHLPPTPLLADQSLRSHELVLSDGRQRWLISVCCANSARANPRQSLALLALQATWTPITGGPARSRLRRMFTGGCDAPSRHLQLSILSSARGTFCQLSSSLEEASPLLLFSLPVHSLYPFSYFPSGT